MTAAKTAAPTTILSGHCGIARHGACAGSYGGYPCRCDCHDEPAEPEPEVPDLLAVMDDVLEDQPVRHCPTCTCGGAP